MGGLGKALVESFVTYMLPVLATGLAALLGLALKRLADKLGAEASESKVAAVGQKLAILVQAVVSDVFLHVKPVIDEAALDGVITEEERRKIRDLAMARVQAALAEKGFKEVAGALGIVAPQVTGLLTGMIESAIALRAGNVVKVEAAAPNP